MPASSLAFRKALEPKAQERSEPVPSRFNEHADRNRERDRARYHAGRFEGAIRLAMKDGRDHHFDWEVEKVNRQGISCRNTNESRYRSKQQVQIIRDRHCSGKMGGYQNSNEICQRKGLADFKYISRKCGSITG